MVIFSLVKMSLKYEKHFNQISKNAYEDSRKKYSAEVYCKNVEEFITLIMRK